MGGRVKWMMGIKKDSCDEMLHKWTPGGCWLRGQSTESLFSRYKIVQIQQG